MTPQFPSPPRGARAFLWRLPIHLYRMGLGWLLGDRFLHLEHRGRNSGLIRHAVLEIIGSDPGQGNYYVGSGFGTRSDWYQNIIADPQVQIQIGRRRFHALAEQLPPEQASQILLQYWNEHPASLAALGKIMGYEIELSEQGVRNFGRKIPVIRFHSKETASE